MLLDLCDRYRDAEIGGTITGEKEQGKNTNSFAVENNLDSKRDVFFAIKAVQFTLKMVCR